MQPAKHNNSNLRSKSTKNLDKIWNNNNIFLSRGEYEPNPTILSSFVQLLGETFINSPNDHIAFYRIRLYSFKLNFPRNFLQ